LRAQSTHRSLIGAGPSARKTDRTEWYRGSSFSQRYQHAQSGSFFDQYAIFLRLNRALFPITHRVDGPEAGQS